MTTDPESADETARFVEAVHEARAEKRSLYLKGGDSKRRLYGRHCDGEPLDLRSHRGIVSYRPTEMVLTARSGTTIHGLEQLLAEKNQRLPFDPGHFGEQATIGGTLATNLSGPARPWRGSVRDAVLGIRLINGRGESLRFGGEVMKNVAGYDVSRLQAGALGTLGLITEVSLRLLPLPDSSLSLVAPMDAPEAITTLRELVRRPLPFAGACWLGGELHLAFEGRARAMESLERELTNFRACDTPPWEDLRNWRVPAGAEDPGIWCLHVAPATPLTGGDRPLVIDWAGARRCYPGDLAEDNVRDIASAAGGHVEHLGGGLSQALAGPRLSPTAQRLQRRVKAALDPDNLFNVGRLYDWL